MLTSIQCNGIHVMKKKQADKNLNKCAKINAQYVQDFAHLYYSAIFWKYIFDSNLWGLKG